VTGGVSVAGVDITEWSVTEWSVGIKQRVVQEC